MLAQNFINRYRYVHIRVSKTPAKPLPNVSVVRYVIEQLKEKPRNNAIIDAETGRVWSSEKVCLSIRNSASSWVNDYGLQRGDSVCFVSTNNDFYAISLFGVIAAGGIVTGTSDNSPYREIRNVCEQTKAKIIVASEGNLMAALKVKDDLPQIEEIIVNSNDQSYYAERNFKTIQTMFKYSKFAINYPIKITDISETIAYIFTSGSTGNPKPAMKTHEIILNYLIQDTVENNSREKCVFAINGPMSHSAAFTHSFCVAVFPTIVIPPKFEVKSFKSYIHKYKVTQFFLVAPCLAQFSNYENENYDLSSLTHIGTGGSPLPTKIPKMLFKNLPNLKYIYQFYASTEVDVAINGMIFKDTENTQELGFVLPGREVKIAEIDKNETLGPNKIGEIRIRGHNVTKGYLNRPDFNAQSFDSDGFFRTMDAGFYDKNGRIYFTERYKQIMKCDGQVVSPTELEDILMSHPSVVESAVIAVKDDFHGEIPKAFVVRKNGFESITEQDLIDYVNEKVTIYKKLRGGLEFRDYFKKTSFGKINKITLN